LSEDKLDRYNFLGTSLVI